MLDCLTTLDFFAARYTIATIEYYTVVLSVACCHVFSRPVPLLVRLYLSYIHHRTLLLSSVVCEWFLLRIFSFGILMIIPVVYDPFRLSWDASDHTISEALRASSDGPEGPVALLLLSGRSLLFGVVVLGGEILGDSIRSGGLREGIVLRDGECRHSSSSSTAIVHMQSYSCPL